MSRRSSGAFYDCGVFVSFEFLRRAWTDFDSDKQSRQSLLLYKHVLSAGGVGNSGFIGSIADDWKKNHGHMAYAGVSDYLIFGNFVKKQLRDL